MQLFVYKDFIFYKGFESPRTGIQIQARVELSLLLWMTKTCLSSLITFTISRVFRLASR